MLRQIPNRTGLAEALCLAAAFFSAPALADPLGAGTGMTLRLTPAATYQEGCFAPCMCPVMMEQPVLGTLKLVYAGFSNGEHSYMVEDVNWLVQVNSEQRIVGAGKYRIGTPGPMTVIQHRLELDLFVGDDPPAHFDSGWVPLSNSGLDITISINGVFCWDRVIKVRALPVPAADYRRYSLDPGSTFQRGCIDGACDCAVGPELPMRGEFALVPLQDNGLFQLFSVVDVRWRAMNANSADGIPLAGFGLYRVGGEVAVQNRMTLSLRVAGEDPQRYDSGLVSSAVVFPLINILTRTHTNCLDTLLHVVASPEGGSGDVCGGIMGVPCPQGEFCKLEPGHCCCDFQGVCTPLSGACPEYYDPVCGCDGMTYSNPCFAEMAGQSIDHWGSCQNWCAFNTDCQNDQFCKFNFGTCGMTNSLGTCTPRPNGCPDVWDPVCGCDDNTYGNECEADAAGVSIRHNGVCEDPCQPTPDGFGCTSCFSNVPEDVCRASVIHLDVHTGAITNTDCDCTNTSACHIEFGNASPFAVGNCPPGQSCQVVRRDSDNDGMDDTFWARCMSNQEGPCCFDIDDGPVRYDSCLPRTEAACEADGGIFAGTNAECGATQACCFGNSNICANLHPLCCLASNGHPAGPGTSCGSASCGEVCGGITGIPCDDSTQFCKLPIGQCCCDHFGMCTPTGGSCPTVLDPVCGCDGLTYSNECEADAAGMSINHRGPCGQPHCPATRFLDQTAHCAGLAFQVRIGLAPPNSTTAIALEDTPPPAWVVSGISNGGFYDATNHKVKWGPFFPPFSEELSYYVTPSFDANSAVCFTGSISVDGINEAICGDACLEPCCPQMNADLPHESCGTCPVTDCNSCDASICGDSRIHMCEIVGYACAWLHGCHDDLSGMTRAAYIWRTGECYCWDDAANNWHPTDCSTTPADGCCNAPSQRSETIGGTTASLDVSSSARSSKTSMRAQRVWVNIDAVSTATAIALEIDVPKGVTVSNVSDGGVWDASAGKVRWGVFFDDLSRTVTFTAHGPSKSSTTSRQSVSNGISTGQWRGVISVDGINYPVSIRH